MKEILNALGKFGLEVLKALDWKTVIYKSFMNTVLPMLEKMAADSASKIDDVIVAGIKQLMIKFLGPIEAQHLLVECGPKDEVKAEVKKAAKA